MTTLTVAREDSPRADAVDASNLRWPGATDEQRDFMRQVYLAHVERGRASRAFVGDLPAGQLREIEDHRRARTDAAEACRRLLAAARSEPEDASLVRAVWRGWPVDPGFVTALVRADRTRIRLARDQTHTVVGCAVSTPLSRDALSGLQRYPPLSRLINAYFAELHEEPTSMAETTEITCHVHAVGDAAPAGTAAALLRESFDALVRGGIHLMCGTTAEQCRALEMLGFEAVAGATTAWSGGHAVVGYVLDLRRRRVEHWVEALAAGRRISPALSAHEIEHELQVVLPR